MFEILNFIKVIEVIIFVSLVDDVPKKQTGIMIFDWNVKQNSTAERTPISFFVLGVFAAVVSNLFLWEDRMTDKTVACHEKRPFFICDNNLFVTLFD